MKRIDKGRFSHLKVWVWLTQSAVYLIKANQLRFQFFFVHILLSFFLFYFVVSVFILIFAARNVKADRIMEVKKVTYEEALARFKRSLEIKHAAQKRMEEEWNRRGIKGTIVSLWLFFRLTVLIDKMSIM